jgi:hypothetical protein
LAPVLVIIIDGQVTSGEFCDGLLGHDILSRLDVHFVDGVLTLKKK